MKKLSFAILILSLILSVCAFAQPVIETVETAAELSEETSEPHGIYSGDCGENVTWQLDTETGVFKISGTGEMYFYFNDAIPWNQYKKSIISVVIDDGVTDICDYAFYNCSNLTDVIMSDSVLSVGRMAFDSCSSLTSVKIGKNVTRLGDYAFKGCTNLENITIPDSVVSIGVSAFNNTKYYNDENNWENDVLYIGNRLIKAKVSLSGSYHIKVGTKSIADSAFYSCDYLEQVVIPYGVTHIGDWTFSYCNSLSSVIIPNGVRVIGEYTFESCVNLSNIDIPDTVTEIGISAFGFCEKLSDVTIPASVTSIGDFAFSDCISLTSIVIPEGVTHIGESAFMFCEELESIEIPTSITSIGMEAFGGCNNISKVYIKDINSFCSINFEDGSNPFRSNSALYVNGILLEELVIPNFVTNIGSVFAGCDSISSVRMHDSVSSLGYFAFGECDNLTTVVLSENLKTIGERAFYFCKNIEHIELPASLETIESLAFYGCDKLKSIIIPDSVTNISDDAIRRSDNITIYCNENSAGHTYAINNNIPYVFLEEGFEIPKNLYASQIRSESPEGMRYAAYIETAVESCEYGYIVTRKSLLEDVSGDKINYNLFKINEKAPGYNETAISGVTEEGLKYVGAVAIAGDTRTIYSTTGDEFGDKSLGDGLYFTTVLKNISEDKYTEKFVGRPYVKTPDGTYFYGDTITRSIYEVAKAIPEADRDEYIQSIIDAVEQAEIDDTYTDVGGLLG